MFCERCGHEQKVGLKFCINCGGQLGRIEHSPHNKIPVKHRTNYLVYIIPVVLVGGIWLAGAGFFISAFTNKTNSKAIPSHSSKRYFKALPAPIRDEYIEYSTKKTQGISEIKFGTGIHEEPNQQVLIGGKNSFSPDQRDLDFFNIVWIAELREPLKATEVDIVVSKISVNGAETVVTKSSLDIADPQARVIYGNYSLLSLYMLGDSTYRMRIRKGLEVLAQGDFKFKQNLKEYQYKKATETTGQGSGAGNGDGIGSGEGIGGGSGEGNGIGDGSRIESGIDNKGDLQH